MLVISYPNKKRKDGRYQGYVEFEDITGEKNRKYIYDRDKQECRRKINELAEEIEKGDLLDPSKATFKEFAKIWLDSYCVSLSPTTLAGYKKSIETYANNHIGNVILKKILPIHIQKMINKFAETHAEKTCKNLLSDISGVFEYAITNKIIKTNPCRGVKIPQDATRYEYYIYTEDEYNKLLDIVTGTRDEIPVLLAGLCGMRVSEIMGLTWNDINFDTCIIHIRRAYVSISKQVIEKTTKTKTSYRDISAPSYVIERLALYKGVGFVYPKSDGTAENGGNYARRFFRLLKKYNLPHTRFHDLRHFNATMMLKKGVSDKEAAGRLGHSEINMTKKYQHILSDMNRNAADILNTIVKIDGVKNGVK